MNTVKFFLIITSCLLVINGFAQGKVSRPSQKTSPSHNQTSSHNSNAKFSVSGQINGHDYVDLGLPSGVKWSTKNIGASSPHESGNYFSWGETRIKYNFNQDNCNTYNLNLSNICGTSYDVANMSWGAPWRIPTEKELRELMDFCLWEWTTQKGQQGHIITGPNGNSIFLPAAGITNGANNNCKNAKGAYWSGTSVGDNGAFLLDFDSKYRHVESYNRISGISIRPVSN